ncbi:hypothetical protein [Flavobacterium sp. LAR06]|uniref:hypothetical protein n=1 Tax=Flavobacterium sp. LAR06 TaxID=3064897 RepID=UPI0035C14D7A
MNMIPKRKTLKNILGLDLLLKETECSTNNILKITRTDSVLPDSSVYLTSYIYNDKDYPTKQTSFTGEGKSIEYEIEYTYEINKSKRQCLNNGGFCYYKCIIFHK